MSPHTDPSTARFAGALSPWRERARGLLVAGLVTSLAACGGGGGGSNTGVGTGGTGSFAVGSISGFGSIIVNGVRYNVGANVVDDDGTALSASDLGLGMTVEIRGSVDNDGVNGTAESVASFSELKGPVTAVNASAGTLTVFGQTVRVNAATVFDDVGGLPALEVGNVVEVYGLPGTGGTITATRIEREAVTIAAYGGDFRVRGAVENLLPEGSDFRFNVATVEVTTNSEATTIDGRLESGVYVSVRLNKLVQPDDSYAAERVQVKTRSYDDDVDEAEIEGLVSDYTSLGEPFKVNGYAVRLDAAVTYDNGAAGSLANGVRVEVEGNVASGVLVAREVKFEDENDDGGNDGSETPFEFNGVATCSPCGNPSGTLDIRGETVVYDELTQFDDGVTPDNLNGASVEIYAVAVTTSVGTTYLATRIELDN